MYKDRNGKKKCVGTKHLKETEPVPWHPLAQLLLLCYYFSRHDGNISSLGHMCEVVCFVLLQRLQPRNYPVGFGTAFVDATRSASSAESAGSFNNAMMRALSFVIFVEFKHHVRIAPSMGS